MNRVSAMSEGEGNQVGSITRFDPFGNYRPNSTPTDITDRGYTGHKHNDDIGLIYMNARYYLPSVGRFASSDTIVPQPFDPQSLNRFSYTKNNPINLIDPSGHCATIPNGTEPDLPDMENDGDCWNKLWELERYWGIDIQDEDLWEYHYLLQLEFVLNNYAQFLGGADVMKDFLAIMAKNAGKDKFVIRGRLDGWCNPDDLGCSGYNQGEIRFNLSKVFSQSPRAAGARQLSNFPGTPEFEYLAARYIIAHEFTH